MTYVPSPEDAAWGALNELTDQRLPTVAAHWLADGYDSDLLREVAAMSTREGHDARRLMPAVLESIRHPFERDIPADRLPWRGHWSQIRWAVHEMDRKFSPYAAAQLVIEVGYDEPDLWEPARGAELVELLRVWDETARDRAVVDDELRVVLRSLNREDVPALRPGLAT